MQTSELPNAVFPSNALQCCGFVRNPTMHFTHYMQSYILNHPIMQWITPYSLSHPIMQCTFLLFLHAVHFSANPS